MSLGRYIIKRYIHVSQILIVKSYTICNFHRLNLQLADWENEGCRPDESVYYFGVVCECHLWLLYGQDMVRETWYARLG